MSNHVPSHPSSSSSSMIQEPACFADSSCYINDHDRWLSYHLDHDNIFVGQNQNQNQNQNQSRFYQNQTLEDAFSRLSVTPHNHTPLDFGGQRSTIFSFDEGFGYPFAPNFSHVGLQKLGWFTNNASSTVPMPSHSNNGRDSGCYGINSLRSSLASSGYQREFQRLLPTISLSKNDDFSIGLGGRSYGRGVVLNNEVSSNNNRNNVPGLNNFNGRRQRWLQNQHHLQQSLSHRSVYDLRGKILFMAKTQCGCRVLQDTLEGLTSQEQVSIVFEELIDDNVLELMADPFGNYVFQKLVEKCSEEQITSIVLIVTKNDFQLVSTCLDIHGTRSVQRLLEHVTNQEQRSLIMSALTSSAVVLSTDMNGLHVVEHCVRHFSNEDTKYMLNIVANNSFEIATDKSGCCVIQQCVDYAEGETKEHLMAQIIVNASLLAEDCYGNYVVQQLVSLKMPRVTKSLMRQLEGKFVSISCNKYGSNVVEKFFQDAGEHNSRRIILELLRHPNVSMLLVDPYANFVISSAVLVSEGVIREAILELVKLHSPMMRSNHYGKKLLGRLRKFLCHV